MLEDMTIALNGFSQIDRYAVVGNPVSHSKSPLLHALFAHKTGQKISYEKLEAPLDQFVSTVEAFRLSGGKGANVTVPFKTSAFEYAHEVSERARRVKSVNTLIFREEGVVEGDSTDGIGLVRDLVQNKGFSLSGKRILLLGAGGAVRGCLLALLEAFPEKLVVCHRDRSKVDSLIAEFSEFSSLSSADYSTLRGEFDLIINGTSASLQGVVPPLPSFFIHPEVTCYDVSYGNQPTVFQTWATGLGAKAAYDGVGMLIEQGAESFYRWRGIRPDTKNIRLI